MQNDLFNMDALNDRQREAVEHTEGALLVLAGAGSGKTRVLTMRIAHLIRNRHVAPHNILAVTFTNKAAREMRERLEVLVEGGHGVWCSTFHSLCVRILRREAKHIDYEPSFTIYDEEDAGRLIASCIERAGVSTEHYPVSFVRRQISSAKDRMIAPNEFASKCEDWRADKLAQIYRAYARNLKANNAMDFDDLILNVLTLFADHPDILAAYAARFCYIHVDEYQDTNQAQYMLVRLLAGYHGNICVVGDDDQSIYGWRGADIGNILNFERDYPGARVVRLEQNYRSMGNILNAANSVIEHNTQRKSKRLWTDRGDGERVEVISVSDEHSEARFLAGKIYQLVQEDGARYRDIAVFYRTHAQSRLLGQMLVNQNIPFRVFGGTGFYQRREIKDALAYLRVLSNPADDVSLSRIVNVPKRGIGDKALEHLQRFAAEREIPLLLAVLDFDPSFIEGGGRIAKPVMEFAALMRRIMAMHEVLPLDELVERMIEMTGLSAQYAQDTEEDRGRRENLQELAGAAAEFLNQSEDEEVTLTDWLGTLSLETQMDEADTSDSAVTMMTIHAAKGLEFPIVFMTGMEEGIFPHSRSIMDESRMEEERRLCYVGITRAMQRLFLSYASRRTLFNQTMRNAPSRFLRELPQRLVQATDMQDQQREAYPARRSKVREDYAMLWAEVTGRSRRVTPKSAPEAPACGADFSAGDKVRHNAFGSGTVISVKGDILSVAFDGRGIKQLSVSVAPLKKI
ncbi:MAG: ATP-dependent helicase [Christensenellales bacterium]|jgi:DNA helicase-2/ATP-dependent DNA helicase PcrA